MYKLIPIIFLFSCSTLQYPITTRYKEKRIKQEWVIVKDSKPKYKPVPRKKMEYDVLIFVVGTILGYKLML